MSGATTTSVDHTWSVDWPLYSCDDHLDLWALPPDLWAARLPRRQRDRGPRVVEIDGAPMWTAEGNVIGISGRPPAGRHSALARAGHGNDGFRPSNPKQRLEDMDRDGVCASVIYGPNVLGLPIGDPELKAACWRAWNDWATEFNSFAPDRLAVLPVLPTHEPAAAAEELVRVAESGHRGALVYCFEFDCGDQQWDVLWSAAQETNLPISFHIGGGVTIPVQQKSWRTMAFSAVVPMQLCQPFATMIYCGALERHPGMKLVLAEAGLGWIPYLLHRMNATAARWSGVATDYALSTIPSELFDNQVYVTFEDEAMAATHVGAIGPDRCMWASDYPHVDSTFPHSIEAIRQSFGALPPDVCRAITADNCRALYGFA